MEFSGGFGLKGGNTEYIRGNHRVMKNGKISTKYQQNIKIYTKYDIQNISKISTKSNSKNNCVIYFLI